MSTIKSDRVDFEKLLNGLDPMTPPMPDQSTAKPAVNGQPAQQGGVVDTASAADMMAVKAFEFDYDAIRKGLRKKARKTVLGMVTHIIPDDIVNEDYIQDKIEQDIETLTELYMQNETNKVMQRSLIDSVSKGNQMPRMYEVFGQLTDKMQSISKQIVDTEQKIRKTYVDLKFEIRDKANENGNAPSNALPSGQDNQPQGLLVTSTRSLINGAKKRHIDQILDDAKEISFDEQ